MIHLSSACRRKKSIRFIWKRLSPIFSSEKMGESRFQMKRMDLYLRTLHKQ